MKKYYPIIALIIFISLVTTLFQFYSPEEIINLVGVHNSYLVVFLISVVGGLSTLTGFVFVTAVATFSAGGANPLLLGLAGGLGIFISDSIFYVIIHHTKKSVPQKWQTHISKIQNWVAKYPSWLVLIAVYFYLGLTPLPSDLMMIALVLAGYSYKKVAPILLLSGFSLALIIAYFGNIYLI